MTHETALAAKIAARNLANQTAMDLFPQMAEALKPFVGQKVCKVDGTLLKKVNEALPKGTNTVQTRGYYSVDDYTLAFRLTTTEHNKARDWTPETQYQHPQSADRTLFLGHLRDGVLTELYDAQTFKTDYTEDFVVQTRKAVREAETALNQVRNSLGDFGMWDQ